MSSPNDKLYGDACSFEANPLSLNYRCCNDVGKVGGDITITYQIKILSLPGPPLTNPEPLSMLIYDKSGSSYHYNNDYATGTRNFFVLDPAAVKIVKSFVSDTIAPGATSTLTLQINNPSPSSQPARPRRSQRPRAPESPPESLPVTAGQHRTLAARRRLNRVARLAPPPWGPSFQGVA